MNGKYIAVILSAMWLILVADARIACGDGGKVQLSERRDERLITVFTAPTPLRAGRVDVSVLLQNADSKAPLPDDLITVHAYPVLHRSNDISAPATTEAATNKLLKAAQLNIAEPGTWHIDVIAQDEVAEPPLGFDVEVGEPTPPWLDLVAWIAWPFVAIGLFAVHELLNFRRAAA